MTTRIRAVLFDMDGTLVHTAPDIASALNAALARNDLAPIDPAQIIDLIGKGSRVLARRAVALHGIDDADLASRVFDDYIAAYGEQIGRQGHAFAGAAECLRTLHERGIHVGVVTNALQRFAEATLTHYGLAKRLSVIVGGDRTSAQKPHPAPLLFACRTLGVEPKEALMVGDSINDVAAARAAGCSIVCVPHGYNEGLPPEELDCEIVPDLAAVVTWLDADAGPRLVPSSAA
ncbi:MAG TPA: phosphoglycolate phosphatase [Rudaea sp.]